MRQSNNKKVILFSVVVILIITAILTNTAIQNRRFRVVSSTPSISGTISTATNGFRLEFNRDIPVNINYVSLLSGNNNIVRRVIPAKRSLTLFINSPVNNKHYSFKLKNIKALSGETIESVNFNYTTKYMPVDNLSKTQQLLITELSEQYKKDFPIINALPHSELQYTLSGYFDNEEGGYNENFFLLARIYLSGYEIKTNREAAIIKYKQQVLDYIKSIGFDPDDYKIEFEIIG